mgnify:CR=1 FL=1|jgi:hypothetical protein
MKIQKLEGHALIQLKFKEIGKQNLKEVGIVLAKNQQKKQSEVCKSLLKIERKLRMLI